ncbi:MAG: LytTR family DNA-binding domain-containing protein [Synergistaceae bacterium]|nr:LytTR family DNA-binding domain-containing protein [Synergistaceae bacterium]
MNTLRVAICEDDGKDAEHLSSLINASGVAAEISLFESGEAFLAFLAGRPAGGFDLVFFDIYMGGVSGVEAAGVLRETDDACGVVFTTSSRDHMPEAFDVGAEQYLIKPVQHEKLEKVLKKRLALMERSQKTCLVNAKGRRVNVPLDHIYYVEAHGHICRVHTANGEIETSSMTMEDFELQLQPPRFLRCYKSYIVNMSYVEKVDRDFIMKNGHRVYIRRDDVAKYARELDKWHLSETGRDEI